MCTASPFAQLYKNKGVTQHKP